MRLKGSGVDGTASDGEGVGRDVVDPNLCGRGRNLVEYVHRKGKKGRQGGELGNLGADCKVKVRVLVRVGTGV